jgi:thioredoxin-related protein
MLFASWSAIAQPDTLAVATTDSAKQEVTFDPTILTDPLERFCAEAQAGKRLLMLYFSTPSCPVCRNMEEGVFTSGTLQQVIADNYIFHKLDAWTEFDGVDLAARFNLRYYPTIILLNDKGKVLQTLVGYTSERNLIDALLQTRKKKSS